MRTAMTMVLAVGLSIGAAGCKADAEAGKASGAAAAVVKLTKAQLEEAKKVVQPFAAWEATFAQVTAKLGAPHGKEGEAVFWRAVEGDKCAKLSMSKKGDQVGTTGIFEYDKAMKSLWDKCAGGAQ